MNGTTPINTATAVGAAAVVTPVVSFIAISFHVALPADVQSAIVVLLVAGAHWIGQVAAARFPAKPTVPAAQ